MTDQVNGTTRVEVNVVDSALAVDELDCARRDVQVPPTQLHAKDVFA